MNEYVEEKVKLPGLALLIVGVLSVLGNLISLVWQAIGAITTIISLLDYGDTASWIAFATSQGWGLFMSLVGFLVAFLVVFAGARLRSARSPGLIYAGSIMSILPCCLGFPCCCLGAPVGIWAIATMQDEQVKAAFEA